MKTKVLFAAMLLIVSSFSFAAQATIVKHISLSKVDLTKAIHKIELGAFEKTVPVKLVELMLQIGEVEAITSDEGSIYYTAPYITETEAAKYLPLYLSLGFEQARHVVQYKKEIYSLRDFNYMADGGKLKDITDVPVIRIWK
jgi:hypothetical protein